MFLFFFEVILLLLLRHIDEATFFGSQLFSIESVFFFFDYFENVLKNWDYNVKTRRKKVGVKQLNLLTIIKKTINYMYFIALIFTKDKRVLKILSFLMRELLLFF